MHGEIAADAVAGAVVEVEAGRPQRRPREAVELGAGGAVGKHRAGNGDVALEHAGEAVAHLSGRLADDHCAGDVGGAVLVLRAGIDEIDFARRDLPVGPAGDSVMDDGAVRAGAGDRRERHVLEEAGVAAERLQRFDRVDLGEPALGRRAVEPGEKAHHRRAVAPMGGAAAGDLGVVLYRFHRRDRIGAARRLAAVPGDRLGDRGGGTRLIELHGAMRGAERGDVCLERRRRPDLGEARERGLRSGGHAICST